MIGDDEFIMGIIDHNEEIGDIIDLEEETTICDETEVINKDRLILIKIFTTLIRMSIDNF